MTSHDGNQWIKAERPLTAFDNFLYCLRYSESISLSNRFIMKYVIL